MCTCFIFFSFITSCDCMCFVGMVRRTRRSEANESDEDVPVSDYSDGSLKNAVTKNKSAVMNNERSAVQRATEKYGVLMPGPSIVNK